MIPSYITNLHGLIMNHCKAFLQGADRLSFGRDGFQTPRDKNAIRTAGSRIYEEKFVCFEGFSLARNSDKFV